MITGGPIDKSLNSTAPTSLWRNRDYVVLLNGQAISRIGTQISQTATPLLVLAITGSAAWAGLLFGMVFVPNLLLCLPAGALIDRWNRKTVMIVCDVLRALALGSIPVALLFGKLTLLQLCITSLIEGTGAAFFTIAETASFPSVIDEAQLGAASGQQQAVNNFSILLGPALAGLLLSAGRLLPFLVDALSYSISVVSLLWIHRPFQEERTEPPLAIVASIREGLTWLWRGPLIRLFTLLAGIGTAIDNALILIFLVIATRQLHASVAATGVAIGIAAGGGGIIGALIANRCMRLIGLARLTIATSWIRVALLPFLLLAPNIVVLGLILFLDGLVLVTQATVLYVTRQQLVPEEIRGRITSVYSLVVLGCPLFGVWTIGASLQWLGIPWTMVILVACTAGAALLVTANRTIRSFSSPHSKTAKGAEG